MLLRLFMPMNIIITPATIKNASKSARLSLDIAHYRGHGHPEDEEHRGRCRA